MSTFFQTLRGRVDANARRAVALYTDKLPDYRQFATSPRARTAIVDLAALLRRREAELAAEERPFTDEDLAVLWAAGEDRGANGVSLPAQRRVIDLHFQLTLTEMQEAAGPDDVDAMLRMLGWLAANGVAAQRAYTQGFLAGQERYLPVVHRVHGLGRALLAGSPVAAEAAQALGMGLPESHLVMVVRLSGGPPPDTGAARERIVAELLRRHHVPMTWEEPAEFTALLPAGDPEAAERRAVALAADLARLAERPCGTAVARGRFPLLADAQALARRVSRVAPAERVPRRVHTVRDLFVELGAGELPGISEWLRGLAGRLASGPDLVTTLDAFYRNDMNRLRTAADLHVHPRTLDYRLHRARELTRIDPGSTRGVRTLSTVVAWLLAGRLTDEPPARPGRRARRAPQAR